MAETVTRILHDRLHLNRAVFYRFLFSYLIILIVTVLLSVITYQEADRIVDKNCRELKLSMLNQARDNVDDFMEQIDELSSELLFNSDVDTMLYQTKIQDGSSDVFNVYELSRSLQVSTINSHYFKGYFYIFFKNSEIVFSHDSTYHGFEYFYNNILSYDDMDYQTWRDSLFRGGYNKKLIPAENVTLNGTKTSAITYSYSLPFSNSSDTSLGVIDFVIEENQLQSMLDKANMDGKGWIGILDQGGTIISKDSRYDYYSSQLFSKLKSSQGYFYQKIDGQDMMVLYSKSSYNNWIYTAILPTSVILMDTRNIQKLAVLIVLITFAVGLFISCLMAYFNTKPIKKVASVVREYVGVYGKSIEKGCVNELDYIEGNIHSIIEDSKTLEDDLGKNAMVLQNMFIDKLIKEGFKNEAEMKLLMDNAGLNIKGAMYGVLIFRIWPRANAALASPLQAGCLQTAKKVLLENIGIENYIIDTGDNVFSVLFVFPSEEELENKLRISRTTEKLQTRMQKDHQMAVSFGIGRICRNLLEIHNSFHEAQRASAFGSELGGESAVWYESLKNTVSGYYYPLNLEIRLINACKSGNRMDTLKALQKIHEENFQRRKLTAYVKKLLFYNMQCTLMKLTQEVHAAQPMCPPEPEEKDWFRDSKPAFEKMGNQFLSVCQVVNSSKKSHNVQLRDDILAFLVANYADSSLGVERIADNFHLSTSYFSQFFKEQIGETFTSYLENLRIHEACLRLEREDVSFEKLAGQVGYNSVYSFRRAFKKVEGVTPLAYRQNARSEADGGRTVQAEAEEPSIPK